MKHTIKFTLCLLGLMATAACQKIEVPTYDVSRTGLNIWVGTSAGSIYDQVAYNFSYAYEEGTITFYARINGMPADRDRTFKLEPYGDMLDSVAATIRAEEYVIPAGAVQGEYEVHFLSKMLPSPTTL